MEKDIYFCVDSAVKVYVRVKDCLRDFEYTLVACYKNTHYIIHITSLIISEKGQICVIVFIAVSLSIVLFKYKYAKVLRWHL